MIQAVFERKPDFRLRDVVIETVIRLPKEEYEQFLSSPCDSYEFIEKNSKPMLMDEKNGVFYCMLVTGRVSGRCVCGGRRISLCEICLLCAGCDSTLL